MGFLARVGWVLQRGRVGRWLLCHCPARDVEGLDDDGVEGAGHGDDGGHDHDELRVALDEAGKDDGVDEAGDAGDHKGADEGQDLLGTAVAQGGDQQRHDHGGDGLGDEVGALDGGGDLDHHAGEKTEDGGLPDLGLDDEGLKAEGRDDELGGEDAAGEAREEFADRHVEDEAGGEQDGVEGECLEVELAAVDGVDGAGLLGGGVLGHGVSPLRGVVARKKGAPGQTGSPLTSRDYGYATRLTIDRPSSGCATTSCCS